MKRFYGISAIILGLSLATFLIGTCCLYLLLPKYYELWIDIWSILAAAMIPVSIFLFSFIQGKEKEENEKEHKHRQSFLSEISLGPCIQDPEKITLNLDIPNSSKIDLIHFDRLECESQIITLDVDKKVELSGNDCIATRQIFVFKKSLIPQEWINKYFKLYYKVFSKEYGLTTKNSYWVGKFCRPSPLYGEVNLIVNTQDLPGEAIRL